MAQDAMRKYAPLWSVLMGATAAVAKKAGTRYLVERKWRLQPSDAVVALLVSAASYVAFRFRFGHEQEGSWYRR